MIKAAIDTGPLKSGDSVRGIGTYVRELSSALKDVELLDFSSKSARELQKFNVLHLTSFNPFFVMWPLLKVKSKVVLTIYDLIPLIYPAHYPPGLKGILGWQVNKWLIKYKTDAIITISETSKKDICRFIKISPSRVHVTYLAPKNVFRKISDKEFLNSVKKKYKLPNRFILYVGDINYNKNIPNLTKASRLAKTPLVVIGKQAAEIKDMDLNHAELSHLKNVDWSGVICLGFVSDEDLAAIYNLAQVYVQPSFYEGFGLGVLEALACGTPSISAKTQALVEVAGNAVVYFDPNDYKDMAKAIKNFKSPGELPREYSWSKTAEETMNVYKRV